MTLLYAAVLLHLMLEVRESFCFTLTSLACQTNGRALFAKKKTDGRAKEQNKIHF